MNKTPFTLSDEDDPVITVFLALLEKDMRSQTDALPTLSENLLNRANALVVSMDVDLNVPLSKNDE